MLKIKTQLNDIEIEKKGDIVSLLFKNGISQLQSCFDKSKNISLMEYCQLMMYSFAFVKDPQNILIAGMGGATIIKEIQRLTNANTDIVEIDQCIPEIAKNYFEFIPSKSTTIFIDDIFNFISKSTKKYDIILIDVFTANYIPYHIRSVEFFEFVKKSIGEKYVVAVNLSPIHNSYLSQIKTLLHVFKNNIYSLTTNDGMSSIIFCSSHDISKELCLDPVIFDEIQYPTVIPSKICETEQIKKSKLLTLKPV